MMLRPKEVPAEKSDEGSQQQKVQQNLSGAIIKIMIAADLIVGVLLGLVGIMRNK